MVLSGWIRIKILKGSSLVTGWQRIRTVGGATLIIGKDRSNALAIIEIEESAF